MTEAALALVPRDGLFLKDGRGWFTSALGQARTLAWPAPTTLAGAVRSAWGRRVEAERGRPLDPAGWLAETQGVRLGPSVALRRTAPGSTVYGAEHRMWPAPLDALVFADDAGQAAAARLVPQASGGTLGSDDDPAREGLLHPGLAAPPKGKPLADAPPWWPEASFVDWLLERPVGFGTQDRERCALARRAEVHLAIDSTTQTARESFLWATEVSETLVPDGAGATHEWAVGVQVELPGPLGRAPLTLGGKGKLARIEELASGALAAPGRLLDGLSGSRGLRLVVVTPAEHERGWLPDGLESRDGRYVGRVAGLEHEVVLRAACVGRPLHVSGWDLAARGGRGAPRPTRRLVPAGSVYFFERVDGQPFTRDDALRLWFSAWGRGQTEGFGRLVPGWWSVEGGNP